MWNADGDKNNNFGINQELEQRVYYLIEQNQLLNEKIIQIQNINYTDNNNLFPPNNFFSKEENFEIESFQFIVAGQCDNSENDMQTEYNFN